MRAEISLNGSVAPAVRYVGWALVPAQVRLSDRAGATGPVNVRLQAQAGPSGGQLTFFRTRSGTGQSQLPITLPLAGTPVPCFIAGRFQRPSTADQDAVAQVVHVTTNEVLGTKALMVRIRKDATSLTADERNRFIAAFAAFNNRGMGRFADFRNAHTQAGSPEAHFNAGFLPWHRAFLLDLERELQTIDPSVSLPYWRFDRRAPTLFTRDFMGVSDAATGRVLFSAANPLQFWVTDGTPGIIRRPQFNTQTSPAARAGRPVLNEAATLALGTAAQIYERFRRMEDDPHGAAHVCFTGSISSIPVAARDPLFFMLHANVDRLWARWQWLNRRFDGTSANTFSPLGAAGAPGTTNVGHNASDTMWPWNGVTTAPRPRTAPGGTMAASALTQAPGPRPTVGSMIDYQGVRRAESRLGFDYDDVPFEFA